MEQIGDVLAGRRGGKRVRARQDREKQEKVIDMKKLDEMIPQLVKLQAAQKNASKDLSDGIKAAAEKCGLLASVVRRFVTAKAGENFDEKKREVKQLALAFDELT